MGGEARDLEKSLLQHKARNWKAPLIILVLECFESTAFFGIATNLVAYLSNVLKETNSESATSAATWSGTSYLTPLLGAVVADAVFGNYKTSFISVVIYLMGMVTITLSALLPSPSSSTLLGISFPSITTASLNTSFVFYAGLYMVAFGSGGLKSSLLPLGAQQFDDENPDDAHRKVTFFSSFYVCVTVGMLFASTAIVWIQENMSWVLGYAIATSCIALGLGIFLLATPTLKIQKPTGSPLKSLLQVLVASFRKSTVKVPIDSSLLFEVEATNKTAEDNTQDIRLMHTDEFKFLDKAAVLTDSDIVSLESPGQSWRLCTVTQVEEMKMLLRMVPVWLTSIVFSIAYAQMGTTFLEQGEAMDNQIGSFSIPPAMLPAFEVLCVIGWSIFFDRVIVPVMRTYTGNPRGLTMLQQMGLGRFLMILSMAATAFTEMKRLEFTRAGKQMSIAWQLPQYFLMGGADALNYIGQLEFFFDQAPNSMKSMGTALNLLSISLGNYGSSFIVSIVGTFTTVGGNPGWIPENLNQGHLDYFFWGLAALSTLNFVIHLACSRKYTHKQVADET